MAATNDEIEPAAEMVRSQIESRGITDRAVLAAMRSVPRHLFVFASTLDNAYEDHPLLIGEGQTISQPYIVALMTACLSLSEDERVLEIGTGSGYQAAVLGKIAAEVFTVEVRELLYRRSRRLFASLGYTNINVRFGDGYFGWPEAAPFNAIIITAAVGRVPPPLFEQLADGGRIVLPLGTPPSHQRLTLITRHGAQYHGEHLTGVTFVPMTGRVLTRDDPV